MHALAFLSWLVAPAFAWPVAITVDDLPWAGAEPAGGHAEKAATVAAMVAVLREAGAPAVGFVNCGKPDQDLLQPWREAGFELANHQQDHANANTTPPDVWLAGAQQCTDALDDHAPVRFFRYPYLRNGGTAERRDALASALTTQQGLQLARVTIDNHEWKLAFLYADAKARGDAMAQARIAQAYTAHVRDAARHFRALAKDKLGREPAHVLLLHANALLAEHGATMLAALAEDGATFISLEQALADPLYAKPDRYVGTGGVSWLYRVDPLTEAWTWDQQAWESVVRPLEVGTP